MAQKVLLAVSQNDERRLDELVDTAADAVSADGTVVVVHAFDRERFESLSAELNLEPQAGTRPDDLAQRHTVAAEVADRLRERGVEVTVRGAVGENGSAIVDLSEEIDADVVVVGGRRRSPSGKALFGSTAQRVLLNADAPVMFVKERESADESADAATPTAD